MVSITTITTPLGVDTDSLSLGPMSTLPDETILAERNATSTRVLGGVARGESKVVHVRSGLQRAGFHNRPLSNKPFCAHRDFEMTIR